jgi:hypothetical protein
MLVHCTAFATPSVTLTWHPSVDTNVAGYKIYYGTVSHVYTNTVSVGNVTNTTLNNLVAGATYFFAATTYGASGLESGFSNEASYNTGVTNTSPTNTVSNAGGTTNTAPTNTVSNTGGTTNTAPTNTVSNTGGTTNSVPTNTVFNAGGATNTIPTNTVSKTGGTTNTIVNTGITNVAPTNTISITKTNPPTVASQPPKLNTLVNLAIKENAPSQIVSLAGISAGAGNPTQALTVTAVSSNPTLIPNPTIAYASPNITGTLTFKPATNACGTATITVTVNNGQAKSNIVTQSFAVTVFAVNQPPTLNPITTYTMNYKSLGTQIIALSGITSGATNENQLLKVAAVSSNPNLIPNPTISYTSPNSTGTLSFKPKLNLFGSINPGMATITVTVNDGAKSNNIVTRQFIVNVVTTPVVTPKVVSAAIVVPIVPAFTPANIVTAPLPATLTAMTSANGQFTFNVSGTPDYQYAVQASSNMTDWVSVETNAAPFVFTDANASQFNQRFYRVVSVSP